MNYNWVKYFLLFASLSCFTEKLAAERSVYKLESFSIVGSERLSKETLEKELSLKKGTLLTDEFVVNTRRYLLGFGVFKSVILVMKKGSEKGFAKLVIDVEDTEGVVGSWAVGSHLKLLYGQLTEGSVSENQGALGYQVNLVSRNILNKLHRGQVFVDFGNKGVFKEAQLAYGLPRFAAEGIQFDAQLQVVDPSFRYLQAFGFGAKTEGLWSLSLEDNTSISYGPALYFNEDRFKFPGSPRFVVGPKLSYQKETRLKSFTDSQGYSYGISGLLAPVESENSVFELALAGTVDLSYAIHMTASSKAMFIGTNKISVRNYLEFVGAEKNSYLTEQSAIYLRINNGLDRMESYKLKGSSVEVGFKWATLGFIAELAFSYTESPIQISSFSNYNEEGATQW
jgi:hypothetical protein